MRARDSGSYCLDTGSNRVLAGVETAEITVLYNAYQEPEELMDAGVGLRKIQRCSSRHNGLYRWILQRTQASRI